MARDLRRRPYAGDRRGDRQRHAQYREGEQEAERHSPQEFCPSGARQAAAGRCGRSVYQPPDGRTWQQQGYSGERLPVLPAEIRRAGGQAGRGVLHAGVCGQDVSRSAPALQWAGL